MFAIRLLIVDDHNFFRRSLMGPLEAEQAIEVVGTAASGDEAVTLCRSLHPDVALMDLNMPYLSGLAAIERIAPTAKAPAILVLTGSDKPDNVIDAFTLGARGYLRKDLITDELLISAIFTVASGGIFLDPVTFSLLKAGFVNQLPGATHRPPSHIQLTPDENILLRYVALGYDNAQISQQLQITAKTVSNRLSQLYLTLQVSNRVQAANFALRHGLIDLKETL